MTPLADERGVILLSAGGTGGHLFPAEALAAELAQRGFEPHLVTDERARRFVSYFHDEHIHLVQSATIAGKNPWRWFCSSWRLFCGLRQSRRLLKTLKPRLVIGFGGYPSLPPLYVATRLNLPTLIHEQNTVMGRANRFLSGRVRAIAAGFPLPQGHHRTKTTVTGNPLREAAIKAAQIPYQSASMGEAFHLLIFGGSQGASVFSSLIPAALGLLDDERRARLHVVQQVRAQELHEVQRLYEALHIHAEIAPFFNDMARRIAAAQLIIARSGGSTVAEIAAIGRPALLVPYPGALDHDQAENAKTLSESGGAIIFAQHDLTPQILAEFLVTALDNPSMLSKMAEQARQSGQPQATARLADLVEKLIKEEQEEPHENAA